MSSSTINLFKQKSDDFEYFSVNEILRSPEDAQKVVTYYNSCCQKAKNGLDQMDAGTLLELGRVRYLPIHVTKKLVKAEKAKVNREKKHAAACC
jgi:hypothetical protein